MAEELDPLELVLHPLRVRILGHMGRTTMTAANLAESLADVPKATLYRHLALLERGGILRVASERRIRGTIERTLEVDPAAAFLPDLDTATRTDLMRCIAVFAAALVGDFDRYLGGSATTPDLAADGVIFDTVDLSLNDAELATFGRALQEAITSASAAEPSAGRRNRRFSIAVMPTADEPLLA